MSSNDFLFSEQLEKIARLERENEELEKQLTEVQEENERMFAELEELMIHCAALESDIEDIAFYNERIKAICDDEEVRENEE